MTTTFIKVAVVLCAMSTLCIHEIPATNTIPLSKPSIEHTP